MTARTTALDSERLRSVAVWNSRAKVDAFIYAKTDLLAPIAADELNLASAEARDAFLARLPDGLREEGASLVQRLAAQVAADRTKPQKPETATPDAPDAPWETAVDGAELLAELQRVLESFVALPPQAAAMLALWIVHTYVTDVADHSPYILVTSPVRACGKTTLLEMLLHLAHDAQMSGGYTAAALYRRIARSPGSAMLLDELDTRLRGDGGEAIRGVLNTGFQRNGKVTICVGDEHEDRDFPTYCAKVLAGIGNVWDTVASRSIPVRMARASKDELRGLRRIRGDRIHGELGPLRRRLLRWTNDVRDLLREADPDMPEALGARESDVWRPLFAIAETAGGHWPAVSHRAAIALHRGGDEETDVGLLLLADLRDMLGDGNAIFTERILAELVQTDDRPWSEYRHDKPITARGVANLLGRFGVKSGTVRIQAATGKGYSRDKLAPAFNRYLEPSTPIPSVTSVTRVSSDAVSAPGSGDVTHVTDGKAGAAEGDRGDVERRL